MGSRVTLESFEAVNCRAAARLSVNERDMQRVTLNDMKKSRFPMVWKGLATLFC